MTKKLRFLKADKSRSFNNEPDVVKKMVREAEREGRVFLAIVIGSNDNRFWNDKDNERMKVWMLNDKVSSRNLVM